MKLPRAYVTKIVHAHNGLTGQVHMARQAMRTIQFAATTTEEAKDLAHELEKGLSKLLPLLKVRVDHEYLVRRFQK